jgi:hypothetical protein
MTPPLLERMEWEKRKMVVNIQRKTIRIFNEEVTKLHYNFKRLSKYTRKELKNLDGWLESELRKCGK